MNLNVCLFCFTFIRPVNTMKEAVDLPYGVALHGEVGTVIKNKNSLVACRKSHVGTLWFHYF